MIPVAPHIVNDVSYVTRINHESHFTWQAHWRVSPVAPRIANDVSYMRESFYVAGAIFGDVGG